MGSPDLSAEAMSERRELEHTDALTRPIREGGTGNPCGERLSGRRKSGTVICRRQRPGPQRLQVRLVREVREHVLPRSRVFIVPFGSIAWMECVDVCGVLCRIAGKGCGVVLGTC